MRLSLRRRCWRFRIVYSFQIVARAEFEWLEESRMWFATVSGFEGLWAHGPSQDSARLELLDVLRSWISIGVWSQADLPLAAEVAAAAVG